MSLTVEQLVIDPQSRFLEMKSLQPYSTTDEYLYAMKEDLADWLSTMYPDWCPITADTFLECLENGVLLCHHANNVNDAAHRKNPSIKLDHCKYRSDARPKTFNARDNVSQFIRWARHTAGVREVLMFESDDLILRKNEKNFLLCLFDIARYGAKFGISVPSLIKLEDEIEREIQREKEIETLVDLDEHKENQLVSTTILPEIVPSPLPLANFSNHLPVVRRQTNDETPETNNVTFEMTNPVKERPLPKYEERENYLEAPPSSSQLHKTVVQIVNSCCCAHRFPVIRIGEGKYRIGEHGTIIFIRILRHHVMVRVGGGWDTLENYLNKHDPCRRSSHHHNRRRPDSRTDIPILAIPNHNISPSVQKNTPFGKSVTIKTEEFPLNKPTTADTNLSDAQLVITRDADGRHRIGQITYKSEEEKSSCPHHHLSSPRGKISSNRDVRRSSTPIYHKQSSPSTDQDYSSLIETGSKPSSSSSFDLKEEEELLERAINSLTVSPLEQSPRLIEPIETRKTPVIDEPVKSNPPRIPNKPLSNSFRANITESIVDGSIDPMSNALREDFDLHDIEDAMKIDLTSMDNDSLESSEGIIDEPKAKPSKFQKTKPPIMTSKSRMNSLTKKPVPTTRRPTLLAAKRSQSTDAVDKIDRDSGIDEQDFRRERLHSNGDDNSSLSSVRSTRSSITTINTYRETKSSELRLKKLDAKRQMNGESRRTSVQSAGSRPSSTDHLLSSAKDRKLISWK